jgi:integrase
MIRPMIKPIKSKKTGKREWQLDIRVSGRRIRATFATRDDAETAMVKVRRDKQLKKFGIRSVADAPAFLDLIERRCATIRSTKERTRARTLLTRLAGLMPRGIAVDQITTPDLQRYVDGRYAVGITPESVKRELNTIGAALYAARVLYPQLGQWIVPQIPRPKGKSRRRERYIAEHERFAIIKVLMADKTSLETEAQARARRLIGMVFRFALVTGMRHGEIDSLQWSQIGEVDIQVHETKNPKNRYIPITPPIREILQERALQTRSRFVFTRSGQGQPKFYQILRDACVAAGVPYGKEADGIRLHDCRHTMTTDLVRAGTDVPTIQSITGHASTEMVLYYSHPSGETRARAAKVMAAVLERKIA